MYLMRGLTDLPPVIAGHLRGFARAAVRRSSTRSGVAALCLFILWALASCAADRLLQLPSHVRLVLLLAGCTLSGLILLQALWRLRREIDWVAAASEIERRDPRFGQRLVTVVSQLAGPRDLRGSDQMISHVLLEVESQIAAGGQRSLQWLWREALPWLACAAAIIAVIALGHDRAMPLRQLAMRFVLPLADIPPVTTTQIQVSPGDHDILQSQPLRIDAEVDRLRGDSVFLSLNTQGDWSRVPMDPAGGRHYSYTLWAVDRDVQYYVSAGDAVTPHYLARVLRPPSVSKFQISYAFPAYVGQAPMTVTNSDGRIEAPFDTDVTLTIFCSEPLQSALLTIGSSKTLMSRTDNDAARSATFKIRSDSPYSIDLISARQVAGGGPAGARIHALLNQPPIARLLEAGEDLRLMPRDIATLNYEAADDYALSSLGLRVQVNDAAPSDRPIPLLPNRRGQQGSVALDLATLPLKIGDVVSVRAVASDSAGQTGVSQPLRIAISPQSIDLDIQQRVADLDAATEFAAKMTGDFESARGAVARADGMQNQQSREFAAASAQANLALANASESATLLRQSLCRALLHTRDQALCVAMADWIDSAQMQSQTADELFRERGDPASDERAIESELQQAIEQGRALADEVRVAAAFQQAAALSAEREDAAPPGREETALQKLGISPGAADIDAQLRAKIDAGEALVRAARPVDFAAAASDWADALQRGDHPAGLRQRLGAAAEAEAVRPDADLLRARDLQLASRAAGAIEASLAEKQPEESAAAAITVNSFASALAALQTESSLRAHPQVAPPADELNAISAAANAARLQMTAWASDAGEQPVASAGDLALQASAAAAAKDYDRAQRLDQALAHRLADAPAVPGVARRKPDDGLEDGRQQVARSMGDARTLDGLGQTQDAVAQQTRAADDGQIARLADQERSVTAAIAAMVTQRSGSTEDNSRDRAAAAFVAVQMELAALPQRLADAQAAGAALHAATRRAADAEAVAARVRAGAPEDAKGMAQRAAEEADNDADDALDRLQQALTPIDAEKASGWADELSGFAPESTAACQLLSSQLAPSLTELARVISAGDAAEVDRAAANARRAIAAVQNELAAALDSLTESDPLVAAKSFAGAAAESLAQSPPDVSGALQQQVRATGALARAWDQSIHDAALRRLEIVPAMQPVCAPTFSANDSPLAGDAATSAGGWGSLQTRDAEPLNFAARDSDPAGYEDSLRIYFQALAKAQAARADAHPAN